MTPPRPGRKPGAAPRTFPLAEASPGKALTLIRVEGGRALRRRLGDMGLAEGVRLRVVQSHAGGPCIVAVGGLRFALGRGVVNRVVVGEE